MFPIKKLYELQEVDWKISAHEKSLTEVRDRLADESAQVSARTQLEALDAKLAERTPQRRQAERAVQQSEEKLQELEKRLYGGAVTNPKELSALDEERIYLQGLRSAEGDQLLDLMVEIEEVQSARNDALEHLKQLEAQFSAEQPELLEALKRLIGELDQMRQARDKTAPEVPNSALPLYESLRKDRNGYAVAKVERGLCQGCRVALPTMELQRARSSQSIVQCNSCRRILYVM